MIVISYIIAIVLFAVVDILGTTVTLTFINAIGHLIGWQNIHNTRIGQYFGAFIGALLGIYVGIKSFEILGHQSNYYLLLPIFGIVWLILNFKINPIHFPISQRLGVLTTLLLVPLVYRPEFFWTIIFIFIGLILSTIFMMLVLPKINEKRMRREVSDDEIEDEDVEFLELFNKRDPVTNFIPREAEIILHTKAIRKNPHDIQRIFLRGRTYYDLRNYDNALADFEAVIALSENNKNELRCYIASHLFVGKICLNKGHIPEARLYLNKVMDIVGKENGRFSHFAQEAKELLK